MREIKFRVWDKKNKLMYYLSESEASAICLEMNNKHWGLFDGNKRKCPRICGDADNSGMLMQYTGLCDKNGKDIYEGDIVLPQYNGFSPREVKFVDGEYNISGLHLPQCVIIGNVWEYPDLLNMED